MKIKDPDLIEFSTWFEMVLSQATKLPRKDKMKMRKKIRDELYALLLWEKPTADVIFNRWEERLGRVFSVMRPDSRQELFKLLKKKLTLPAN
jgi:hypothetical protein